MKRSCGAWAFTCVIILGAARAAHAQYVFTTIDYPDANATEFLGIGNAGQIVGDYQDFGGTFHSFVLSGGVFMSFDVPGSYGSSAFGINSAGQVVGNYGAPGVESAAFLRNGDNFADLVPLASSTYTTAFSINDAGHVVGSHRLPSGAPRGYLFDGTTYMTGLNRPGATETVFLRNNNSGQIVGTYVAGGQRKGFRLSGGAYTTIDVAGAAFTLAEGINDSGQIVGSSMDSSNNFHGFVYDGGAYTPFDVPGASSTRALGINNAGQVAGFFVDDAGTHGYLMTPAMAADFDLDGYVDDGDLAAWTANYGLTPGAARSQGDADANHDVDGADFLVWQQQLNASETVAAAVPEPVALELVAASLLGFTMRRGRGRPVKG